MRKYFIVSDVHSFYKEMQQALSEAGFDINNPDHIFVSCGDLLDRGGFPTDCLKFVYMLPNNRKVLIRGNHEDLLEKAIARRWFDWCDYHNGTQETAEIISEYEKVVNGKNGDEFELCKNSELLNDYLNSTVNYAMVGNNVFVHGWLPWYYEDGKATYKFDDYVDKWQRAEAWYRARWENGMEQWAQFGHDENYTVFCGHWHTSWGHSLIHKEGYEWGEDAHFEPFIDDGIVALDACTAYSGKVNCYVLEME